MRKLALLLFVVCVFVLLNVSKSSEVISIDDSSEDDKPKQPLVVGSKRSPIIDLEEDQPQGRRGPTDLLLPCGHRYSPVSINNQFLSDAQMKTYKCSSCNEEISYESFIGHLIKKEHVPKDITYVESRLSRLQINNLAKVAIKEPSGRLLSNLIKLKVPFFSSETTVVFAARVASPEVVNILLNSDLETVNDFMERYRCCLYFSVYFQNFAVSESIWKTENFGLKMIFRSTGIIASMIGFRNTWDTDLSDNFLRTIDWLIEKGTGVNLSFNNSKTKTNRPAIHVAIFYNDRPVIKHLLKKGADLKAKDSENLTPVLFAARHGKTKALEVLLEHLESSSRIEYTDDGWNVFHLAIINGHIETLEFLMSRGFPLLTENGTITYLLHRAIKLNDAKLLEFLLLKGANPLEIIEPRYYDKFMTENPGYKNLFFKNDPAIVLAIIDDQFDIVEKFLDFHVSPNTRIADGGSSLFHLACQLKRPEIAKLFISRNVDHLAVDKFGRPACSYSSQELRDQIFKKFRLNLEI